jgi:hypothetical protein
LMQKPPTRGLATCWRMAPAREWIIHSWKMWRAG